MGQSRESFGSCRYAACRVAGLLLLAAVSAGRPAAAQSPCVNGVAGGFPCEQVGLLSHMPLDAFDLGFALRVWGFYDLNTEREYALVAFREGIAVVDVTDPVTPRHIATVLGDTAAFRDVRTYQFFDETAGRWRAYAYVTSREGILEGQVSIFREEDVARRATELIHAPQDRLMIIDLSGLPNDVSLAARATDDLTALSVNLANVDGETGVALPGVEPVLFVSGSGSADGAFRAYGLDDPLSPTLLAESSSGGSTHVESAIVSDVRADQCPNRTTHCVISVDFADRRIDLWDGTDPGDFRLLSTLGYNLTSVYSGGWISEDGRFLLINEPSDMPAVQVYSLADLAAPVPAGGWGEQGLDPAESRAIGRGNRYYVGIGDPRLTVLDITDPVQPAPIGSFGILPVDEEFNLVVGVYPRLPSGTILLGEYKAGLFALTDESLTPDQGQLRFATATAAGTEGNAVGLSVARSGGTADDVTVGYETLAGSADSSDFVTTAGTLSWAAGDGTDKVIEIDLAADALDEGVERFFVRLFDPRNGATLGVPRLASVFVNEIGAVSRIEFDRAAVAGTEGPGAVVLVPVRRIGGVLGEVSVAYRTVQGTALEGVDYVGESAGALSWPDQDGRSRVIEIPLIEDGVAEPVEWFQLELLAADGGALGSATTIDVRILNPAPVAIVGDPRSVGVGATVSLDGGRSRDPEGEPLTYAWSQEAGRTVELNNPNRATMTFTAPGVPSRSRLEFYLTVTDPAGNAATDRVTITVVPGLRDGGGGGGMGWPVLAALMLAGAARRRAVRKVLGPPRG